MQLFDFTILRDLRKQHQLSIADLSGQSGVSSAVISKLERNQTRAELDTLYKLAKVFGITSAELLGLAENKSSHRLEATQHRSEDFLFSQISYRNIRCLYGKAPKNARVSRPKVHRDDYELCWVLQGKLQITLPDEVHILEAGQSLQFDALLEHVYQVLEDCEILILHIHKEKRF